MTNFYFDYKVIFYLAWRSDLRHAFFVYIYRIINDAIDKKAGIYFCGGSIHRLDVKRFGLNATSCIKAFIISIVLRQI